MELPPVVLIDTDVGSDDCVPLVALFHAHSEKKIEIRAITSCFGNVEVDQATANARGLIQQKLSCKSPKISVFQGAGEPLVLARNPIAKYKGHGETGTGSIKFKIDKKRGENSPHATLEIIRLAKECQEKERRFVIHNLGPLTNLALALHLDFNSADRISLVVSMIGTSQGKGNVRLLGEFNSVCDPEAFSICLSKLNERNFKIVPYEATIACGVPPSILEHPTPEACLLKKILSTYVDMVLSDSENLNHAPKQLSTLRLYNNIGTAIYSGR